MLNKNGHYFNTNFVVLGPKTDGVINGSFVAALMARKYDFQPKSPGPTRFGPQMRAFLLLVNENRLLHESNNR